MSDLFRGKTAIISGGAGGIGFALAKEFGLAGMNIVLADIDETQLQIAQQSLLDEGIEVLSSVLDVTLYVQWQQTVSAAQQRFGKIHMLINNAGVGGIPGTIEDTDHATWRWVVDVNLMGVVYGTQAVTPALKEHNEQSWIINVASMAGMGGVPFAGAYTATKAAVVAMSESWAVELQPYNIHVASLCPAFVKTRIHESHRNRQAQYKLPPKSDRNGQPGGKYKAAALVEGGIDPGILSRRVLEALTSGQHYIFTHPNYRSVMEDRAKAIDLAFVDAQSSPVVAHLKDLEIVHL
jgi:NAD(P)-dependent dehydrogenase (short-subunit alcohol dehydrogenase family)